MFQAWAKSYVDTIMRLPRQYTHKEETIKRSDNITPGRFSKSMLVRYRLNGLYSFKVFLKYRFYLPFVTNVPIKKCMVISCMPASLLRLLFGKGLIEEEMWDIRLQDIINAIGSKEIIVYGAGLYGERVVKNLKNSGNISRMIGVAVTDKSKSVSDIEGVRVYEIGELLEYRKKAAVIIATLPGAACSIRKVLKTNNFKHYYALLGY